MMSDELKPYRLCGLRFVHDSRGKHIRDGGLAYLSDDKARKILNSLKRQGRPEVLVLEEPKKVQSPKAEKPKAAPPEPIEAEQSEQSSDDGLLSVDIIGAALALHFTKRKLIASMLAGEEIESTPEADQIIKEADGEKLAALIEEVSEA
jgi:hypothetical protein